MHTDSMQKRFWGNNATFLIFTTLLHPHLTFKALWGAGMLISL